MSDAPPIFKLADQIDSVKTKLTDNEYKEMMDVLKDIHYNLSEASGSRGLQQTQQATNQALLYQYEDDEDDDDYEVVPKRGTDAWYRMPLRFQAKFSGMNIDSYIDWTYDHLTIADVNWYKAHPTEIPSFLEDHPLIVPKDTTCICM